MTTTIMSSNNSSSWPKQVGPLRWFVALLALISLPCAFLQDTKLNPPWDIIIGAAMPGMALFLIWAIPLDILMAKVFKAEADAATQAHYRTVIRFDLMVLLLMALTWGYFFVQVIILRVN